MSALAALLMCDVFKRAKGNAGQLRTLLDDASAQAVYCLDAPDCVEDGAEWVVYCGTDGFRGVAPRVVRLRP